MAIKQNKIPNPPILDFSIVALPDDDPSEIKPAGSNQRKLLIVCELEADHAANITLLEKILAAVKYNLSNDCQLICLKQNQSISFSTFASKNGFKNVLIFGPISRKLGLNFDFKWYYPIEHNDCTFLFANHLSVIQSDKAHKSALWGALQEMFSI